MSLPEKQFIKYVQDYCADHGFACKLEPSEHVIYESDGELVNGYFSGEDKELKVAIGKDESLWIPILVHEFCHATQYVEDPKWFDDMTSHCEIFFNWLTNPTENISDEIKTSALQVAYLESDCEQRSVEAIKKHNLTDYINVEDYAQKANSYATFYKFMIDSKKWYSPGKEPYNLKEVWSLFPKEVVLHGCDLTDEMIVAYKNCIES